MAQRSTKKVKNLKEIFSLKGVIVVVVITVLSLWCLASLAYIGYDQWTDFQRDQMTAAYREGTADVIQTIIREVEQCRIVPLYEEDKTIRVISVDCISGQQEVEEEGEED